MKIDATIFGDDFKTEYDTETGLFDSRHFTQGEISEQIKILESDIKENKK